ncbi:MAG TPA: DUF3800 domain-containing protein [Dehalococcoidia bacterium]|nr:DUF3800 domain-containing protein [Dehalococcoidia bacterium]
MHIYLDESGDLGFSEKSTKFFTIACVTMDNTTLFRRSVKKVKVKYDIPRDTELKGYKTRNEIKRDLLTRLAALDIEIHAITVKKANVDKKFQKDTNILYNYMVGLSLVPIILRQPADARIFINVDRRTISLTSGFKFNEYLKYKTWYEGNRPDINLEIHHMDSHEDYGIQGIDVICNSVYRKYSSGNYKLFNLLRSRIRTDRRLFFTKQK